MYRARRYWNNFNSSDPTTQIIAIVALVLLVIINLLETILVSAIARIG